MNIAKIIAREDWAERPDVWQGEFEGGAFGANVSVMFYTTDRIGGGPKLHRHPYAEVFIIRQGRALFTVGGQEIDATAGQILVAPANTHTNLLILVPDDWKRRISMSRMHSRQNGWSSFEAGDCPLNLKRAPTLPF